jgi:hypothetical protein
MSTKKTYTIEIQLDAAQQALGDTSKKLADLDKKLEGLDRNSDAAKAIVAEMAKLAKQAEASEAELAGLAARLDGLKPGSLPALRAQVEELEEAFNQTVRGTKEFDNALLALGNAKGELKAIEDAIDALDPKMKAAAFVDFANGVVGAFGVASAAAQTLGIGSDTVQEYEQRLLSCIAVLDSMEQVSRALNSETLSVVKSALASGKAWLTAGESASTGAKVTRTALISTGIGAIVVLVGLLIANWDRLTSSVKGSEAFFTKFRAVTSGLFDAFIAQLKVAFTLLGDLFTGNIGQLVIDAKEGGKKVGEAYSKGYQESIAESNRKVIQGQIEAQDRLIEVLKARGVQTYQLEEANLVAKLKQQKRGTDDEKKQYLDLAKELDVLRTTHGVKERADAEALTQARLGGVLALEQAAGRDSYKAQLVLEQQKLAALKSAADPQLAAIAAQENAISSLILAEAKKRADKRQALEAAAIQAALVRRTAQGGEEYKLALDQNALQEKAAQQHLNALRTAAQVDAAAVVAAQAELFRIQVERADIHNAEEKRQEQAHLDAVFDLHEFAYQRDVAAKTKRDQQEATRSAQVNAAAQRVATQSAAATAEAVRLAAIPKLNFGDNVLFRLFGLHPTQLETTKQKLAEAAEALNSVVQVALAIEQQEADGALAAAQERLTSVTQALNDAQSAADATASQLASADGARREYLIQKLEKQRAAEDKLRAEKAKSLKDEQQAAKVKAQLDKEAAAASLAAALASTIATGAKSVESAVNVIAGASKLPFPANLAAVVTGLAVVTAAVLQAKQLGKSLGSGGELGDGGEIVGGSHASGNDVPVLGGRYRLEGKEMITNVRSTQNNRDWLHFINREGKTRALTAADFMAQEAASVRVLPPSRSSGAFGDGGEMGGGTSGGSVVVEKADLSALLETNQQQLAYIRELTGHAAVTAAKPPIGREGALELRKMAEEVDDWEKQVTL